MLLAFIQAGVESLANQLISAINAKGEGRHTIKFVATNIAPFLLSLTQRIASLVLNLKCIRIHKLEDDRSECSQ